MQEVGQEQIEGDPDLYTKEKDEGLFHPVQNELAVPAIDENAAVTRSQWTMPQI